VATVFRVDSTLTPTLSQRERGPFGVGGKFGVNLYHTRRHYRRNRGQGPLLRVSHGVGWTGWGLRFTPNGSLSRLRGRVREGERSTGLAEV